MSGVILKKGKESILRSKNHWIFSGAIESYPKNYSDGDVTPILSHDGKLLGYGYFNRKSSLAGRVVSFGEKLESIWQKALKLREQFFNERTTAFRLINGEGDAIPGLIVDRYGDYFVVQFGTLGMEKMKAWVIEQLLLLNPKGIYEKSTAPSRKEEGLEKQEGLLWGEMPDVVEVLEEGLRFEVDIRKGQKTGFFLDQREMRNWVRANAKARRVLNCFSYSGGFSVHAMAGSAREVTSVDISEEAVALCDRNLGLNGFEGNSIAADVFEYLRKSELNYDLVILDPPAFAKKKGEVDGACRGYKEINRVAMQKMPKGSILLTCSCSYHVDEELFQKVLFQAASDAGKDVRIIGKHRLSVDHPINIFHPQADYLKSFILYIC